MHEMNVNAAPGKRVDAAAASGSGVRDDRADVQRESALRIPGTVLDFGGGRKVVG